MTESHNPETEAEPSTCRVKKQATSEIVVAGASTSEDVCPWELGPEPRSRKNSMQLDSGSSSSDISVTVGDVSERLRRQCGLIQQYTLDGDRIRPGQSGRKLSAASYYTETRRASVSAPLALLKDVDRRGVTSSTEECANSENTASSSLTLVADSAGGSGGDVTDKIEEPTASSSTVPTAKTTTSKKNHHGLVKTCSVTGSNAPIISVSSVTDDHEVQEVLVRTNVVDEEESEDSDDKDKTGEGNINLEGDKSIDLTVDTAVEVEKFGSSEEVVEPCCSQRQTTPPSVPPQHLHLAPLAVPDCESPVSESAPEEASAQEQLEAKSNDVCPWEDE